MAAAAAIRPPVMQAQPAVIAASVVAAPPPSISGEVFPNSSLYVGDLDASVNESKLYDLFSQVVPVVSVRICTDLTHRSLGYAYVNFNNHMDACAARDALNCTYVEGKPMRIMFSHRDPSFRKSGIGNVYIKNLDSTIDTKQLYKTFSAFGTVLSCKLALNHNEQSKGFGFVQFDKEEAAQAAIQKLNGVLMNDKKVYVGPFVRQQERNRSPKFTNVYVKNLSESATDETLMKMFEKFGTITSAIVVKDTDGKSKCFGFVNFESPAEAVAAVEHLNGTAVDDKVLYVGRAEKKTEREAELKRQFEQERNSRLEKLKGANLYLKNLNDTINDEKLKELFSEFGTITSCKLMRDPNGVSKGSGFVAFSSPKEATKALNEMNGKMIGGKPLYVAVAQRKEERKALLQSHFAQARSSGTLSPVMPGYHGGAPRVAPQQVYFGPGLIPQAPAYGYQQQHLPGLPPSNFVMPYQLQPQTQTQHGQRLNPRRGPQSQQQIYSNQGVNRYMANGRNSLVPGPIMPVPVDPSAVEPRASIEIPITAPLSRSTLASALASASPDNQRAMLGEQLYPLVEHLEHTHTAKVTGMLLEMDQTEVLHLIESPDALKKKVGEAMRVLRLASSASSDIADQIISSQS